MAMGMFVVPDWKRLMKPTTAGHEIAEPDADGHGQEDPERQVAIEELESWVSGGHPALLFIFGSSGCSMDSPLFFMSHVN